MTMLNKGSLLDLIPENRTNVEFVTDAKQVDDSQKNVKMVGASWCAYSKIAVSQFNDACGDMKDGKCYLFDITNEDSAKAAKDLGLKVDGFPTHFVSNGNDEQEKLVGMRPSKVLKGEIEKSGFSMK